jgi:uncharacterized sulfatase
MRAVLSGAIAIVALCSPTLAADKPNILFILTDDQGWPTLGSYGGKIVPTPNLDRIAAEGARFTAAYVTPICTPTRATLMSGQYTARNKMFHVLIDPWYGSPFAPMEEVPFKSQYPKDGFTIAKGLKAAGYTTGYMGKWHLSNGPDGNYIGLNPDHGRVYGFDYVGPMMDRAEFGAGRDRGVMTFTNQAIDFIAQSKDKPWFCFVSHHMIHSDVVAPDDIADEYREKGYGEEGPNRAIYLAGLDIIDRSVGRLLDTLDELGETKDTMVVFLSDNGGVDERHEHRTMQRPHPPAPKFGVNLAEYSNAPLRDGKGSNYEGGIRVPMIVRWPGEIEPGTVIDDRVHAIDIAPTFLSAASARKPIGHVLDGVDLTRLMRTGKEPDVLNRPLYQYYPSYDFNWGLTPSASIIFNDYKLIEYFGDRVDRNRQYVSGHHIELFNLKNDLGETKNLANSHSRRADMLLTLLHSWMDSLGAGAPGSNPHHDPDMAFTTTSEIPEWVTIIP